MPNFVFWILGAIVHLSGGWIIFRIIQDIIYCRKNNHNYDIPLGIAVGFLILIVGSDFLIAIMLSSK